MPETTQESQYVAINDNAFLLKGLVRLAGSIGLPQTQTLSLTALSEYINNQATWVGVLYKKHALLMAARISSGLYPDIHLFVPSQLRDQQNKALPVQSAMAEFWKKITAYQRQPTIPLSKAAFYIPAKIQEVPGAHAPDDEDRIVTTSLAHPKFTSNFLGAHCNRNPYLSKIDEVFKTPSLTYFYDLALSKRPSQMVILQQGPAYQGEFALQYS